MLNNDKSASEALQSNLKDQGVEIQDMGDYGNLPDTGLMQTRSPYSTAVQVVKPRELNIVESRCINEAARAGDDFYYSWSQGGSIIEGNTVGAALMMIRNWGNCAIDVRVQELPNSYVFYGAFIDLETGFNLVRPFKMAKQSPKNKQGREIYAGDRGKDIIFQIGASKAIRNVALNALPKWLTEKVLSTAKKNVVKQVEQMGREKALQIITKKIEALKVPLDRVEANYGKKESWDIDKIVAVMGAIRSIEDGIESMEEVFSDKVAVNGDPEIKTKDDKISPAEEEKPAEKKAKGKKDSPAMEENNPDYWIAQLQNTKTEADLDQWEEKNLKEIGRFGGADAENIAKARLEHRKVLRAKK